jgi:hypothetical protein
LASYFGWEDYQSADPAYTRRTNQWWQSKAKGRRRVDDDDLSDERIDALYQADLRKPRRPAPPTPAPAGPPPEVHPLRAIQDEIEELQYGPQDATTQQKIAALRQKMAQIMGQ